MEEPSDAELDAIAARIRRHRRRSALAKLAGVGVAFIALLAGLTVSYASVPLGFGAAGGRLFWILTAVGAAAGAFVYRALDPRDDPADDPR